MRSLISVAALAILCSPLCRLSAQDIPPYVPANPLLESRSALYSQPMITPHSGWQIRFLTDYYNAVEAAHSADGLRTSSFDAEVLQSDLWVTRDISSRVFILGNVALRSAYNGFMDSFLIWYHHFVGLPVPARDERPLNTYQWHMELPDTTVDRAAPGVFLGDVRAGAGVRFGRAQLVATITLPTTTVRADGWGRKTIGTSLALTAEPVHSKRISVDASVTAGYTPTQGGLARYQQSTFVGGMVAAKWKFAGQQSLYSTFWAQSSNWRNTGLIAADDAEVIGDFGFLFHVGKKCPELQLGITEDLVPKGPAMDIGFTIGLRW